MATLKEFFSLSLQYLRLRRIGKECDKYFRMETELSAQRYLIHTLADEYEKTYGVTLCDDETLLASLKKYL